MNHFSKLCCIILLVFAQMLQAQNSKSYKIHSHNDYEQKTPFWSAFDNGLHSIEVDVFLKNNTLYACHEESKILTDRTIENLYLQPLQQVISLKMTDTIATQVLIDIKSETVATLNKLVELLQKYPSLIQNKKLSFVISGNQPEVSKYTNYPNYIQFDYQSLENKLSQEQWNKVALISMNFAQYSSWNGKGRLTEGDYEKVKSVIDQAHRLGKPFRFWGCPDAKTAWKTFADLGVDFINTDLPYESSRYLNTLDKRVYYNTIESKVYQPTFASDRKNTTVKNVIFMVGDGNGLSQISSAVLANGGKLTLTQLRSLGLIKTQSADDFTTDSAAGGTAFATGEKTYNRSIGMNMKEQPLVNMTELLTPKGFNTACVTTDEITGATPAAFYAHQKDRGMTTAIANDLLKSNLSLFVGGGRSDFPSEASISNFSILNSVDAIGISKQDKVGLFLAEKGIPSVLNGRGNLLAQATKNSLFFLKNKNKPFFLMVEGAQIDTNGHINNVSGIVAEGIDFDRAITEAIQFADQNLNTLVVITADHETSGFSIPQGSLKDKMIEGDFTTYDHTATMVPVFAYGPQSDLFTGVYENNEIFHKILQALAIKTMK